MRQQGAALFVRAGQGGELAADLENKGLVAVGWPLLDDLSEIGDPDQLRRVLNERNAATRVNQSVDELGDFLFALHPGSTVVTYHRRDRVYLIGTVVGPYEYRPDLRLTTSVEPFKHVRRATWRRGARRDDLSEARKNAFPPYKTTFWLDEEALAELGGDPPAPAPGSYWWVNQGTNYATEKAGGYLWAPHANKQGHALKHWSDLEQARPGDVVFNYANTAIRAISTVTRAAVDDPRPGGTSHDDWEGDGYRLAIDYRELDKPLPLKDVPPELRAGGVGPFTVDGSVKQGYFFPLTEDFGKALQKLVHASPEQYKPPRLEEETSRWDEFAYWAGLQRDRPDFDADERDYKLLIAGRLRDAKAQVLSGEPAWTRSLRRAFAAPNNLTSWQVHSAFLRWCEAEPDLAKGALGALWESPRPERDRVMSFISQIPDDIKASRRPVIFAFLLMASGPEEHPPYRTTPFERGYELTGYPAVAPGAERVDEYEHAMTFLDVALAECRARGVELRDRLDAQSVLWAITMSPVPGDWDEDTQQRFQAYRGGEGPTEDAVTDAQSIYEELCGAEVQINFPEWIVTDYLLSLAAKPFVLLSGISGTGKTQIAQIAAELLAGQEDVLEAEPVKREDAQSAYHTVGKSTLAQGLVIPRESEHLFPDAESGNRQAVVIRTRRNGEYQASVEQVVFSDPRRAPIMRLMWRKEMKQWLRGASEIGDVLRISPTSEDPNTMDVEVIKPRRTVKRTDARRVCLVPIRADWTDNRDLLGFFNVLTEQYEPTDLLHLLLRAVDQPERLHFVILDEMNLAKVEYYFADFLSAMETTERGQGIPLHDQQEDVVIDLDGEDRIVPRRLPIPANVFFTGTVNIDETTHMFSRKVLDRANVVEFHDVDIRRHLGFTSAGTSSVPSLRLRSDTDVAKLLTTPRDRKRDRAVLDGELGRSLSVIHDVLRDYNLHFGYRVVDECARFLWLAKMHAGPSSLQAALDIQVLQKVLPKLAGNRSELQEPLERLLSYFAKGVDAQLGLDDVESIRNFDVSNAQLPLSAAKVRRMLEKLTAVGFTSFVE